MKFTKAVQCDNCEEIQLSMSISSFKSFLKNIGWLQVINGNGTTSEFCCKKCYEEYKKTISFENKS